MPLIALVKRIRMSRRAKPLLAMEPRFATTLFDVRSTDPCDEVALTKEELDGRTFVKNEFVAMDGPRLLAQVEIMMSAPETTRFVARLILATRSEAWMCGER